MPFFSICIPVYKNVEYLQMLLVSIQEQSFQDFEIIISDDSPDSSIESWISQNFPGLEFQYFKNITPLGTPANWNHAISKSKGEWIKLMHDDDWFASNKALMELYNALNDSNSKFAYCHYENRFVNDTSKGFGKLSVFGIRKFLMLKNPVSLYGRNIIGPPSVVCVHHSVKERYDEKLKWLVDIDFYMRVLKYSKPVYIEKLLVYIGVGEEQVTQYTQNQPRVEIPEGMHMLSKLGVSSFKNIYFYDAWWRLVRNMGIRVRNDFEKYVPGQSIPLPIKGIINHQGMISVKLLKNGPVSKVCMTISWLTQKINGNF